MAKLAERNAAIAARLPRSAESAMQPMFCFETALNCLFWASLCYDYREVRLLLG